MRKTIILMFLFGLVLFGALLVLCNHASANPDIYYNVATDCFWVNDTVDANLTGWLYDYDNLHGLGQIKKNNPSQYEFFADVWLNHNAGAVAYYNDSNKDIVVSLDSTSTTDYWMYFYYPVRCNFSHMSYLHNTTGTVVYYLWFWSHYAGDYINCYYCSWNSNKAASNDRLGASGAGVTKVNMYWCSMNNMYIQRAGGVIQNSNFVNRDTGAPILNYDIDVGSTDIQIYNCLYGIQGIGTPTVRGVTMNGITSYFFYTAQTGVVYKFIDCYALDDNYVFYTGTGGAANARYTTRIKAIDVTDSSGIADVFVNISSYNIADNSGFALQFLSTAATGYTPENVHTNFTYKQGFNAQKYFYHIITVEKAGYYPVSINTTITRERNWTLVMIPLPIPAVPSISSEENLVNCTGTLEYSWVVPYTQLKIWANMSSPVYLFQNLINATGTLQAHWSGTVQNIYANDTGNTTAIALNENIVNATGTHTYTLEADGYHVLADYLGDTTPINLFHMFTNCWGSYDYQLLAGGYRVDANITGNANTTGGVSLLVDNPNPANSTNFGYNFLQANVLGINTSITFQYANITTDSLTFNFSSNSSGSWVSYGIVVMNSNGSVSMVNPNMTANNTQYWWRVVPTNSTGAELANETWTFTTGNPKQIIPLYSDSMSIEQGFTGGLMLMLPASVLGLIIMDRRKKKTIIKEG